MLVDVNPITNSDLNSHCFACYPYGKLELFKTELVIIENYTIKWQGKFKITRKVELQGKLDKKIEPYP